MNAKKTGLTGTAAMGGQLHQSVVCDGVACFRYGVALIFSWLSVFLCNGFACVVMAWHCVCGGVALL